MPRLVFHFLILMHMLVATRRCALAAAGDVDPLDVESGWNTGAIAVQSDASIIAGGSFSKVQGTVRRSLARLRVDGSLDLTFDPTPDSTVSGIVVQGDGRVVLSGSFTTLSPNGGGAISRNRMARLNADGTLDMGFDPFPSDAVNCMVMQADGKMLLGGEFTGFHPRGGALVARSRLARIDANGMPDSAFTTGANGSILAMALQTDGRSLVVGSFTTISPNGGAPVVRNRIARLNADGTLDVGFDPNANGSVRSVSLQPDGKIILTGDFTELSPNGGGPVARSRIVRLNAEGTVDSGFNSELFVSTVNDLAVQADGKILIAGSFAHFPVGGGAAIVRKGVGRLNADGTVDGEFDPHPNSADVQAIALQANGRILLGGGFTALAPQGGGSVARSYFARLYNDPATDVLSAVESGRVEWMHSGAAAGIGQVTFDLSVDGGGTWSRLGSGRPTESGSKWILEGLNLPPGGVLRARGRTVSKNGSGMIEKVSLFGEETQSVVSGVSPVDGIAAGGTQVIVSGAGFAAAIGAKVGGVPLADFRVVDDNTITGTTEAHASGVVDVIVTGQDGRDSRGGINGFRFVDTPELFIDDLQVPEGDGWNSATFTVRLSSPAPSGGVTFDVATADGTAKQPDDYGPTSSRGLKIHAGMSSSPFRVSINADYTLESDEMFTARVTNVSNAVVGDDQAVATIINDDLPLSVRATDQRITTITSNITINGDGFAKVANKNSVRFSPGATSGTVISASKTGLVVSLSGLMVGDLSVTVVADGVSSGPPVHVATVIAPTPGDLDSLDLKLANNQLSVYAAAVQPDGRIILCGDYYGSFVSDLCRINRDGSIDEQFRIDLSGHGNAVGVQGDGSVVIGGEFYAVNPRNGYMVTRDHLMRVTARGGLDGGFIPTPNGAVHCIAVQEDDKILIGGVFTALSPNGGAAVTRNRIARIDRDGALDATFNPSADGSVNCVAIQPDGKIVIAGAFRSLAPNGGAAVTRDGVARLLPNGTVDTSFRPSVALGGGEGARCLVLLPDGKIMISGLRLNSDGSRDTSFSINLGGSLYTTAVQADGNVVLGGDFSTVSSRGVSWIRHNIAMVNAEGSVNPVFDPNTRDEAGYDPSRPFGNVFSLSLQEDGQILVGGTFRALSPNGGMTFERNHFVRLFNEPARGRLAVTGTTQVDWYRGATAPILTQAAFDLSTDGGTTWNPLGHGTLVPSTTNWKLTGLNLPSSGVLRARGRTTGGYRNGSSGLVGKETTFDFADANLAALQVNGGTLFPGFDPGISSYQAKVPGSASSVTVTAETGGAQAVVQIRINGGSYTSVTSGQPSGDLPLVSGENTVDLLVTSQNGTNTKIYTVSVSHWSALETWRQQHFGTTANAGEAADTASPRGDGLPNLLKFAMGLDPAVPGVRPVGIVKSDGNLEFSYPRSREAVGECAFIVEWTDSLQTGGWSADGVAEQILSDDGTFQQVRATVPAGNAARRYVRLRINTP